MRKCKVKIHPCTITWTNTSHAVIHRHSVSANANGFSIKLLTVLLRSFITAVRSADAFTCSSCAFFWSAWIDSASFNFASSIFFMSPANWENQAGACWPLFLFLVWPLPDVEGCTLSGAAAAAVSATASVSDTLPLLYADAVPATSVYPNSTAFGSTAGSPPIMSVRRS